MIFGQKSFTLLETLIALFVIIIATVGIFTLISRNLTLASFLSSKLIAAYLAQEGMELVRNIRDSNFISRSPWDQGLLTGEFSLDYKTQSLPDPNCPLGASLKFDGLFFNCTTGQETRFKRKMTISQKIDLNGDDIPDRMAVSSEIQWQERGKNFSLQVSGNLYSWFR